ncbi:MAG: hypothetical protein FJX34_02695 [Alphaproteobacteria bacterium]|nr:hypothetical protein [Alphaproteobacteria bacterium]
MSELQSAARIVEPTSGGTKNRCPGNKTSLGYAPIFLNRNSSYSQDFLGRQDYSQSFFAAAPHELSELQSAARIVEPTSGGTKKTAAQEIKPHLATPQ